MTMVQLCTMELMISALMAIQLSLLLTMIYQKLDKGMDFQVQTGIILRQLTVQLHE